MAVDSDRSNVIKQGFLEKYKKSLKGWSKRWAVLRDTALYIYKERDMNHQSQKIMLRNVATINERAESEGDRAFAFTVVYHNSNTLCLSAENDDDKTSWLESLRKAVATCQAEDGKRDGVSSPNRQRSSSRTLADILLPKVFRRKRRDKKVEHEEHKAEPDPPLKGDKPKRQVGERTQKQLEVEAYLLKLASELKTNLGGEMTRFIDLSHNPTRTGGVSPVLISTSISALQYRAAPTAAAATAGDTTPPLSSSPSASAAAPQLPFTPVPPLQRNTLPPQLLVALDRSGSRPALDRSMSAAIPRIVERPNGADHASTAAAVSTTPQAAAPLPPQHSEPSPPSGASPAPGASSLAPQTPVPNGRPSTPQKFRPIPPGARDTVRPVLPPKPPARGNTVGYFHVDTAGAARPPLRKSRSFHGGVLEKAIAEEAAAAANESEADQAVSTWRRPVTRVGQLEAAANKLLAASDSATAKKPPQASAMHNDGTKQSLMHNYTPPTPPPRGPPTSAATAPTSLNHALSAPSNLRSAKPPVPSTRPPPHSMAAVPPRHPPPPAPRSAAAAEPAPANGGGPPPSDHAAKSLSTSQSGDVETPPSYPAPQPPPASAKPRTRGFTGPPAPQRDAAAADVDTATPPPAKPPPATPPPKTAIKPTGDSVKPPPPAGSVKTTPTKPQPRVTLVASDTRRPPIGGYQAVHGMRPRSGTEGDIVAPNSRKERPRLPQLLFFENVLPQSSQPIPPPNRRPPAPPTRALPAAPVSSANGSAAVNGRNAAPANAVPTTNSEGNVSQPNGATAEPPAGYVGLDSASRRSGPAPVPFKPQHLFANPTFKHPTGGIRPRSRSWGGDPHVLSGV